MLTPNLVETLTEKVEAGPVNRPLLKIEVHYTDEEDQVKHRMLNVQTRLFNFGLTSDDFIIQWIRHEEGGGNAEQPIPCFVYRLGDDKELRFDRSFGAVSLFWQAVRLLR
jgi:hypothetical protein